LCEWFSLIEKPSLDDHAIVRCILDSPNRLESAFAALFLNRTSFSGILTSGPIGGYDQLMRVKDKDTNTFKRDKKGNYIKTTTKWPVHCRYNSELVVKGINGVHNLVGKKLTSNAKYFRNFLEDLLRDTKGNIFLYLDPPYYEKGNQLYRHGMTDNEHSQLAEFLKEHKKTRRLEWVLSYDSCDRIRQLYSWAVTRPLRVRYSISGDERESWSSKDELIITKPKSDKKKKEDTR